LQIFASDNKQKLPPPRRPDNSLDETWRLRVLYDDGYIRDPKAFINPFNAVGGKRGLGQNIFGGNRDCYFSAAHIISTTWDGKNNVPTYLRIIEDTRVPLVWDQRAENENSSSNQMKTPDGRFGGYFGYIDGNVKLIGKPDHVIRGGVRPGDYLGNY
jgi:hypothetical protein